MRQITCDEGVDGLVMSLSDLALRRKQSGVLFPLVRVEVSEVLRGGATLDSDYCSVVEIGSKVSIIRFIGSGIGSKTFRYFDNTHVCTNLAGA